MKSSTDTQARLDWEQGKTNYPSQGGADHVQRAWKYLSPDKWLAYKSQFPGLGQAQAIVLGKPTPYAGTQRYTDGSALVRIHDGLVFFVQALSMAAAAGFNLVTSTGVQTQAPLAPVEVDEALMSVYRQWPKLWRKEEITSPAITLSEDLRAIADAHFVLALIFIVLHEYGHVALDHELTARNASQEHEADSWAIDCLMRLFGRPTGQERIVLAGAVVSIRAFAALERLYPKPEADDPPAVKYPSPDSRLFTIVRSFAVDMDELTFYDKSTIAYANDMRLEAMERAFAKLPYLAPVRSDRLISMIASGLIEMQAGRMTIDMMTETVSHEITRANEKTLAEAGHIAQRVFSTDQPCYSDPGGLGPRAKFMIDTFPLLVQRMPTSAKRFFERTQSCH